MILVFMQFSYACPAAMSEQDVKINIHDGQRRLCSANLGLEYMIREDDCWTTKSVNETCNYAVSSNPSTLSSI